MNTLTPLLAALLTATPLLAAEPAPKPSPDAPLLAASSNIFAGDLLRELDKEPGNVLFSPWSVQTALGMVHAGATGQVQKDLAATMRLTLSPDQAPPAFGALMAALKPAADAKKTPAYTLHQANHLWSSGDAGLQKPYADLLAADFNAGARQLNFSDAPAAAATINTWVSDQTNTLIPKLLDPKDIPSAGMILTNAIYFKGRWIEPFPAGGTKDGAFTLKNGESVTLPRMSQVQTLAYGQLQNARFCTLHYHGGMAMDVILPDEKMMNKTIASLNADALDTIAHKGYQQKLRLVLPKFTVNTHRSILAPLTAMGMASATKPSSGFSAATSRPNTYITDVIHAAAIIVDETGTEAAAATGVGLRTGAPAQPPKIVDFIVDRPFLIMIRHPATGLVLFVGKIEDPRL